MKQLMTKIRCKIYREGRAGRSYLDVFVFEVMRGRDEQQMLQLQAIISRTSSFSRRL